MEIQREHSLVTGKDLTGIKWKIVHSANTVAAQKFDELMHTKASLTDLDSGGYATNFTEEKG